jgi:hypothetical protein
MESEWEQLAKELEEVAQKARASAAKLDYRQHHVKSQLHIEARAYEISVRRIREVERAGRTDPVER